MRSKWSVIVSSLMIVLMVSFTYAKEETGKVLQKLVERVDAKLTKLEDTIEHQARKQTEIREELREHKATYDKTKNQMDKAETKADIIGKLSELNQYDRRQVRATLDTIVSVVGDLSRMETVLQTSDFSPDAVKKQRQRIRTVLLNVGPILKTVRSSLEGKAARRRAKTIENTLVMLFRQLDLPANDSEGIISHVQNTLNTLQDVAVQMRMVEELLGMEKIILTVAAHNQIAEMVLLRMTNARLGEYNINAVAVRMHEEIAARINGYSQVMTSSIMDTEDSDEEPESDQEIIDKIRNQEIPEL